MDSRRLCEWPAPLGRQGFRTIRSSSSAVCRIAFSTPYALAPAASRPWAEKRPRHWRMAAVAISSRGR